MKNYKIGLLKGDGIGPEIVSSAVRVLEAVGKKRNIEFTTKSTSSKINELNLGSVVLVVKENYENTEHFSKFNKIVIRTSK